jgi:uncharacterized protein YigE (DUF2233 family)
MNLKKIFIYPLLVIIFFVVFTALQNSSQTNKAYIFLEKYNSISNKIDSFDIEIINLKKEINKLEKDTLKNKTQKNNLIADCEDLNKKQKADSTTVINDTLLNQKLANCDSLEQKKLKYDKNISELRAKIKASNQSIEHLSNAKEVAKKQLDSEIKNVHKVSNGISGSHSLNFKGTSYHIFVANADSSEIKIHWKDLNGKNFVSIKSLFTYLVSNKFIPQMITNAGMYTPSLSPQGLFVSDRKEIVPLDLRNPKTDANFYLKPNGVYYIDTANKSHIEITDSFFKKYDCKDLSVEYATQSGPMLVIDGEIHKSFNKGSPNRKIRSGVGIMNENKTVFILSLDETNFYDFALLFRDVFNCKNALFLDGAISQMYLKDIAPNIMGGQFGPMISVTLKTDTIKNK